MAEQRQATPAPVFIIIMRILGLPGTGRAQSLRLLTSLRVAGARYEVENGTGGVARHA